MKLKFPSKKATETQDSFSQNKLQRFLYSRFLQTIVSLLVIILTFISLSLFYIDQFRDHNDPLDFEKLPYVQYDTRIGLKNSAITIRDFINNNQFNEAREYCINNNIAVARVWHSNHSDTEYTDDNSLWMWCNEELISDYYTIVKWAQNGKEFYSPWKDEATSFISVLISIAESPNSTLSQYWLICTKLPLEKAALLTSLFAVLGLIFVIFLSCKRKYNPTNQLKDLSTIPFDLLTLTVILTVNHLLHVVSKIINHFNIFYDFPMVYDNIKIATALFIIILLIFFWILTLVRRIRYKIFWKHTFLYFIYKILRNKPTILRNSMNQKLMPPLRKILLLFNNTPLLYKGTAGIILLFIFEFILLYTVEKPEIRLFFWILTKGILLGFIIYTLLRIQKLLQSTQKLADSNFQQKIDTTHLRGEFKVHAELLNNFSDITIHAVEESIKSERMKTELITNVSHDLKTPVTSIINYTDLLSNECLESEHAKEYLEVLQRQSSRLKRLIDDLLEASKAATGNLDVELIPCEASILLTQAAGEYEQRLENAGLTLITTQSEEPMKIMADGRRLWRVFDNLLSNIQKYAQEGTRVYLSLEKQDNFAVITFKNISRDQLNVSPDELMERFVRGDASRNTTGSGLGLSIAKSLTELQNGTLHLSIDGDLFKSILRFPIIEGTDTDNSL